MNVVGTVLLTSIENPLCPGCDNYKPEAAILETWVRSLRADLAVVIKDELPLAECDVLTARANIPVEFFHVEAVQPSDVNLFAARWMLLGNWLRVAADVEWVWFTDGSDVRMLNEPWPHMKSDVLYVGSENDTVSNRWILDNHPSLQGFAAEHSNNRLLNAGLLGGDRATVLRFLEDFTPRAVELTAAGDLTDMAAFNLALYEGSAMFETGPPIHTRFGAWAKSDPVAYFAHK